MLEQPEKKLTAMGRSRCAYLRVGGVPAEPPAAMLPDADVGALAMAAATMDIPGWLGTGTCF